MALDLSNKHIKSGRDDEQKWTDAGDVVVVRYKAVRHFVVKRANG